eukprot:CAMPEP_0182478192 /NCGR_PEP_ID=MMETSP1319-20130603/32139_1 /TAXON_ID=172717 /ORGANISM="Bolidomonas pacifica, Strain RCC208" /LENGTH=170 /DNA_ID=CAMNT_0024679505 /DNA_START=79 /DNA_END=588 /DNA_ORIENTATION=-
MAYALSLDGCTLKLYSDELSASSPISIALPSSCCFTSSNASLVNPRPHGPKGSNYLVAWSSSECYALLLSRDGSSITRSVPLFPQGSTFYAVAVPPHPSSSQPASGTPYAPCLALLSPLSSSLQGEPGGTELWIHDQSGTRQSCVVPPSLAVSFPPPSPSAPSALDALTV